MMNAIVSSKMYNNNQDDFNFPFRDGDIPRSHFYGVYISKLIRFALVCSIVIDLHNINQF